MERVFLIYSPTAWSSLKHLNHRSLPSYGRLDVIFRSVISAFKTIEGYRSNVKVISVHDGPPNPPLTITFKCELLKSTRPKNEVELAEALLRSYGDPSKVEVSNSKISKVITWLRKSKYFLVYLREGGEDINRVLEDLGGDERIAFILGSHVDIPKAVEDMILKYVDSTASLGPKSYLTSQAIVLANYFLDRHEATKTS